MKGYRSWGFGSRFGREREGVGSGEAGGGDLETYVCVKVPVLDLF